MPKIDAFSSAEFLVGNEPSRYCCILCGGLQCAQAGARCDYGLYVGATSSNSGGLYKLAKHAVAMKMYLNETFSTLQLQSIGHWMEVCILGSSFSAKNGLMWH